MCSVCPGIATNRMICTHESVGLKEFIEQEQHHAVQQSQDKVNFDNHGTGGYWGTVFDEDRIQLSSSRSVTEVDYTLKLSRNFFHYKSDNKGVMLLLCSVINAEEISKGESERKMLFVYVDDTSYCVE